MASVVSLAGRLQTLAQGRAGHIVDQLIAERGGKLVSHPLWPAMRPILYAALHYEAAVRLADTIARLSAEDAFRHLSELLKLDVSASGLDRIPRTGGFLMVANHPTGIADGVAVYDLLKNVRPDMTFFANRDAIRVNPRFRDMIIPVEWRDTHKSREKTRETLELTNQAVEAAKATILFPSGRIAYWNEDRLTERPWKSSAVSFARRYGLPVVPVHVSARNSGLFYWLSKQSTELRDMTVFHELLNKKGRPFRFVIGKPITPDRLEGDSSAVTKALEDHTVHALGRDGNADFMAPAPAQISEKALDAA